MTTAMLKTSLIIQGEKPTQTTTQSQQTSQDVQTAARDLREAIRNNINAELNKAGVQRRGAAQSGSQATTPTAPTPPASQREITIQRPDGRTVITVPPPFGPFGPN